jgi:branched-chain amino acid transport system ATP-binding protein
MDEAKEISRKYLEAVNFPEERYDWPIGKISIGERKRLKFAMSFAREPQVLLFDEIFPGLTEGEIKEYIWLLNWYIKEKNPAVLVVEHIMKVIMSICNRVIVMNHGKKIAEGVPEEVANNPDVICAYLGERYKLKR